MTTTYGAAQDLHAARHAPGGADPVNAVPMWTGPGTVYALNQQVVSPNNDVVSAAVVHTSSAAFATDVAKWNLSTNVLTPTVANNTYVTAGSAFADISKYAGVDPTGVTECHAALQTALDACASAGQRAYAKGTFATTGTLTITGSVDLTDATINYTGTGTAIVVGATGSYLFRKQIRLPQVTNLSKTIAGWSQVAGSVGVKVINASSCDFYVPNVKNFETGLDFYGTNSLGNCYNTVNLGQLDNNKVNLLLSCDGVGWTNQNTFVGGRLSHNSSEGVGASGARQVQMTGATFWPGNNTFTGTSFEGIYQEYTLNLDDGEDNLFINCRFEGPATVRWGDRAYRNWILGQSGTVAYNSITVVRYGGEDQNFILSSIGAAGVAGVDVPRLEPIAGVVAIDAYTYLYSGVSVYLSSNVTSMTCTGGYDGQKLSITLQRDGSSSTFVWPTNFRFAKNTAPVCTGTWVQTTVTMQYFKPTGKWGEVSRAESVPAVW